MPGSPDFFQSSPRLLAECAVVERVRRADPKRLDPLLQVAPMVYDAEGRALLRGIFEEYIAVARTADLPILLCAPTWRADRERVAKSDFPASINEDAARFMLSLRDSHPDCRIAIAGLIGVRGDCYRPSQALAAEQSQAFHAWQAARLADGGVDFLFATTIPSLCEATGLARAMSQTGRPYFLSFVLGADGNLLDGVAPSEAIAEIDRDLDGERPVGYLFNCCYPTFFRADDFDTRLLPRLLGFQANGSALDPRDLDRSDALTMEPIEAWASDLFDFHAKTSAPLLGGCCGTDARHLRRLADMLIGKPQAPANGSGTCRGSR